MNRFVLSVALLAANGAHADIERITTDKPVQATMDALEMAVTDAGATVFARVDHGAGAASVDMELTEAQLLIFGNPMLGTPAMQDDIAAGLFLPLKILVYSNEDGETVIAWQEVEEMFDDLEINDDAEYIGKMEGALKRFAEAAAQ